MVLGFSVLRVCCCCCCSYWFNLICLFRYSLPESVFVGNTFLGICPISSRLSICWYAIILFQSYNPVPVVSMIVHPLSYLVLSILFSQLILLKILNFAFQRSRSCFWSILFCFWALCHLIHISLFSSANFKLTFVILSVSEI